MKKNNKVKKVKSNLLIKVGQVIIGALILVILFLIPTIIKFKLGVILTTVIATTLISIFYKDKLVLLLKKTNSYFNTEKGYNFLVILIIEVL